MDAGRKLKNETEICIDRIHTIGDKKISIKMFQNHIRFLDEKGNLLGKSILNGKITNSSLNDAATACVNAKIFSTAKEAKQELTQGNFLSILELLWKSFELQYEHTKETNSADLVLKIDNYVDNVQLFHKKQPFFYDEAGIFWFWEKGEFFWKMVDEVDVLISIDTELRFSGQIISSKIRSNYLNAFKHVGRMNKPNVFPKHWVQFKNKIFDIETKTVFDASPKYFSCNSLKWAIGANSETPRIDELFESWVGVERKESLYEILAYCCLTDYPIHLIFCLVGCGRNGKSQFQKIIQRLLGDHNTCCSELDSLIDNRFESAKLYKKLVCTMGETNFGVMKKTSLLKKLSGGDLIGYEFKNKKPFDDFNYAKLIINSNSMPTSLDTSDGFFRRWMTITFPNEFPEGKDIMETIPEGEYNALAKKITELLPTILSKGKITGQGTISERKKAYILASNPLSLFIEKYCIKNDEEYTKADKLYNAYVRFLNYAKKRKVSRNEFYSILEDEGFYRTRTSKATVDDNGPRYENGYFIESLALIPDWELQIQQVRGLKGDLTTL